MKSILFSLMAAAVFFLNACSSAPAKKDDVSSVQGSPVEMKTPQKIQPEVPRIDSLPQNIDAAHESFIRASILELHGEKSLANVFWQHAAESDPYNRFLAFKLAEIIYAGGADSLALVQAQHGNTLPGKVTSSQLALLAHLYVKAGQADSCRKYFNAALDSSRYQDMSLLYDYSLFLEAVHDEKELVRVYDLLLPQVNYISSLMQRQLALLLDQGKDSAVVELFGKAHDATGDKALLLKMVQGLAFQKRDAEAWAIVDTLTGSAKEDETMIVLMLGTIGDKEGARAYDFLKKKYYEDKVRTPVITSFLGYQESIAGQLDSAKAHLLFAAQNMVDQRVYVTNAYHALANISIKEKHYDEAVRYAQMADSVALGGDKMMLAMTYGMAKKYDKAYSMLDSLIAVWDKWTPIAGISDTATMTRMNAEVDANKLQFRHLYARLLTSQAQDIFNGSQGDSAKMAPSLTCRAKAHEFYQYLAAVDSNNMELKTLMAINLERLGRTKESFELFEYLLDSSRAKYVDRPELLNYYGYTLIDMNRSPEEVERGYQMVLQALAGTKTASEAYLDSKAWGLYRKGQYAEALEVMKQVKSDHMEEDFVYWEHLAAIQNALDMKEEAKASYKRLQKLRPKHPDVLQYFKGKKK